MDSKLLVYFTEGHSFGQTTLLWPVNENEEKDCIAKAVSIGRKMHYLHFPDLFSESFTGTDHLKVHRRESKPMIIAVSFLRPILLNDWLEER